MQAAYLVAISGWALCLAGNAQAQTTTRQPLLLKAVPQHVVVSGYWVELERNWKRHPQHSLTFTPQLYAGPTGRPDVHNYNKPPDEKVHGGGLQVQHRWYLRAPQAAFPTGWYLSYGPHLQRFAISSDKLGWKEVVDATGLPRWEYGAVGRRSKNITRYGATAQVGYQVPLSAGPFFLDLCVGAGWRKAHNEYDNLYRTGSSDYGHEGFYFPASIKLGVALQ